MVDQNSRRRFLIASSLGLGSLASSKVLARATAPWINERKLKNPEKLPKSANFPLGVQSGDVTENSAILWTYYEGMFRVALCIWKKGSLALTHMLATERQEGGYIHADVSDFESSSVYEYAFVEIDFNNAPLGRTLIGQFKTTPGEDELAPVSLGAISCINNRFEPRMLEHAAKHNLDAFLFTGDSSYNDSAESLDDYRKYWAVNYKKKGFLQLHSKTSVIRTLDDHEITDNFNPETISETKFQAAIHSFFDNNPIRRNKEHPNRVWRSHKFGRTLEVFTLDCRTERLPSKKEQYISPEQMHFLKEGLSNSRAKFKVIMNSVPISTFPFPYTRDRWQGYPQQRYEILSFIDNEPIENVLWVAGDFHFASLGYVSKIGPGQKQRELLAGPGAQVPNYLGAALNLSTQFDWASAKNNYVKLDFDPKDDEIKITFFSGNQIPKLIKLDDIDINKIKISL